MKLRSDFAVPAEPARVFPLLLNPDVMRSCIPGCEELVRVDDMTYRGRLVNTIAHVRFNAGFSANLTEVNAPNEVRAVVKGEDHRLGSSIKVDARLSVRPDEGASSVVGYEVEVALWGKIGRLGESIVRRRTEEVQRQFVTAFSAICTATGPASIGAAPAGTTTTAATNATRVALAPAKAPASPPVPWWRRLLRWLRGGRP